MEFPGSANLILSAAKPDRGVNPNAKSMRTIPIHAWKFLLIRCSVQLEPFAGIIDESRQTPRVARQTARTAGPKAAFEPGSNHALKTSNRERRASFPFTS